MKKFVIDLEYLENSEIVYKISRFPDGQQSVNLSEADLSFIEGSEVTIKSRFNGFKDLELIICANKALREAGASKVNLFVPYFLGARSDRKFAEGGVNYLKEVVCPLINLQKFDSVTVFDPHSDVLEACLNNFKKVDNVELVRFALTELYGKDQLKSGVDQFEYLKNKVCLVSPDAGALKKVFHVAESIGYANDIVISAKHRDLATGKITHTEVPLSNTNPGQDFVIIDDICDGGRTFIEIAKVIKSHVWRGDDYFTGKIYLIVSHGIFSAGFDDLGDYFDGIFCTNSVRDFPKAVSNAKGEKFIHQLNVFQ